MRTLSRRVWSLLGFAMLLAVVLLYLNGRRPSARVAVVQASRQTLSSSISSNGKVEPIVPYSLRAKFDGQPEHVAQELRTAIRDEVAVSVSIGLGTSKMVSHGSRSARIHYNMSSLENRSA